MRTHCKRGHELTPENVLWIRTRNQRSCRICTTTARRAWYRLHPKPRARRASLEERFWPKVDRRGADECWLWTGASSTVGYGVFMLGPREVATRKGTTAHRVAYELLVGPIPNGLHVDHLCRVRACVNPAHLEPVTITENNRRALVVRTFPTVCPKGHALTPDNISPYSAGHGCWTCRRTRNRERMRRVARERRAAA